MVDLVLDIVLKIIICRNLIKEHALIVSGKENATMQLYFQIGSAYVYLIKPNLYIHTYIQILEYGVLILLCRAQIQFHS